MLPWGIRSIYVNHCMLSSSLNQFILPLQNEAVNDFKKRIAHYEDQYQTLDEAQEPDLSFLKIFNCGKKVSVYQHEGHIQSRIVYFLMNLHLQVLHTCTHAIPLLLNICMLQKVWNELLQPRTIYLCRHGQSEYNEAGRLGGDSGLTDCGRSEHPWRMKSWAKTIFQAVQQKTGPIY